MQAPRRLRPNLVGHKFRRFYFVTAHDFKPCRRQSIKPLLRLPGDGSARFNLSSPWELLQQSIAPASAGSKAEPDNTRISDALHQDSGAAPDNDGGASDQAVRHERGLLQPVQGFVKILVTEVAPVNAAVDPCSYRMDDLYTHGARDGWYPDIDSARPLFERGSGPGAWRDLAHRRAAILQSHARSRRLRIVMELE